MKLIISCTFFSVLYFVHKSTSPASLHFSVKSSIQVEQIHTTSPQQKSTIKKKSPLKLRLFSKSMTIYITADWDLSCVGRAREKRQQCFFDSAGSHCSLRFTLHETTEQHVHLQFNKPNRLLVLPDFNKSEQHNIILYVT